MPGEEKATQRLIRLPCDWVGLSGGGESWDLDPYAPRLDVTVRKTAVVESGMGFKCARH